MFPHSLLLSSRHLSPLNRRVALVQMMLDLQQYHPLIKCERQSNAPGGQKLLEGVEGDVDQTE